MHTVLNQMKNYFLSYSSLYSQWHTWLFKCVTNQNWPNSQERCAISWNEWKVQIFPIFVSNIWAILYWNSEGKKMLGGLHLPKPPVFARGLDPTGSAPLGPTYFLIEDLSLTGYRLNQLGSHKSLPDFFRKFHIFRKECALLWKLFFSIWVFFLCDF